MTKTSKAMPVVEELLDNDLMPLIRQALVERAAQYLGCADEVQRLEWIDDICGDVVTFDEAEKAVAKLGNGWRMPTRQELESCLDLSRDDPAVDTEKHPHVKSDWYWSSTPCAWSSDHVWAVNFDYGDVNDLPRDCDARVRAVRSVPRAA